jgi:hypothetical protein
VPPKTRFDGSVVDVGCSWGAEFDVEVGFEKGGSVGVLMVWGSKA